MITLPAHINAAGLLPFLALLGQEAQGRDVQLDFSQLRRVTPAGLVALAAKVSLWRSEGHTVTPLHLSECPIIGYLQRMDLLTSCGFSHPETFVRNEAKGRFVPVRHIDHRVEEMGTDMASCVAPGGEDWEHPLAGLYDLVWYVLTEMANNVRQHSGGSGFAAAQVGAQSEGLVRLAIADNGRGILTSFQEAGLPWSMNLSNVDAILKALEPRISSKGQPSNEGVGLTLTSQLAKLTGAWLLLVSGNGTVKIAPSGAITHEQLPYGSSYQGTLIALTFPQDKVPNFPDLLDSAKRQSGLLRPQPGLGRFSV